MLQFIVIAFVLLLFACFEGFLFHMFYNVLMIGIFGFNIPHMSFSMCCVLGVLVAVLLAEN